MAFGNGFGALTSPVPEGTLSPGGVSTVNMPSVDVAGISADVTFAGLAPGLIGVNQVNFELPAGLPTSSGTPLQINLLSVPSNVVTLSVLANGGTITASSLGGSPGSTVSVPITLVLGTGVIADSVSFTVSVTPSAGAPAVAGSLGFQQSSSMPAPTGTNTLVANSVTVSWSGLQALLGGTVPLGNVLVPIASGTTGKIYSLQVTAASASRGSTSLDLLPGANGTLTIAGGSVNFGATQTSPGTTVSIPVNLVLPAGTSIDSIAFGMSLNPGLGALAIAGPLTFQKDAGIPASPTVDNTFLPNIIAVTFLNLQTPLSGTVHLGDIRTTIPANALNGQIYTAAFTSTTISASLANTAVSLGAGPSELIPVLVSYLVGDAYPYTSNIAGGFGDGLLNTLDLITALRAVTNIPGFLPASCSDRFDAMDSFPVDAPTQRGGDGFLNTLDLVETLKRVTNIDTSRPTRLSHGLPCANGAAAPDAFRRPVAGSMWFGDAQAVEDGVARVPVYLRAASSLDLAGLSFAVGLQGQGNSLQFVPAEIGAPSLTDSGVPGAMAVAWPNGLRIPSGEAVIGYVQVSGVDTAAGFSLVFHGVDANLRGDGRSVQFETPRRR